MSELHRAVPSPPAPTAVRKVSAGAAYIGIAAAFVIACWFALGVFSPAPPTCLPSALSKGMVKADVVLVCGEPRSRSTDQYLDGRTEEFWFYADGAVYFVDGRLRNAIWRR